LKPVVPPTGSHGEPPSRLIDDTLASAARNSPDGPDFVRSLGLKPSFHLTTGTFNLFVKDPTAFRLSGAFRCTRTASGAPRNGSERTPKPASLQSSRTLETNLTNLPRYATFCQTTISTANLKSKQRSAVARESLSRSTSLPPPRERRSKFVSKDR